MTIKMIVIIINLLLLFLFLLPSFLFPIKDIGNITGHVNHGYTCNKIVMYCSREIMH